MKFVAPEMEIKMFSICDILTASGETGGQPTEPTTEFIPDQPDCPAELPLDLN